MRVAIFQFWDISPHLETSFELVSKHLKAGDDLSYFWGGHAPFIEHSVIPRVSNQFRSQSKVRRASRLMNRALGYDLKINSSWLSLDWENDFIVDDFSKSEILSLSYEQFDVGRAALSSFMKITQSSLDEVNLAAYSNMIVDIIGSGIHVYNSARNIFSESVYDRIYVFNGRFINDAAVHAAAKLFNIPCFLHERGGSLGQYSVTDYLVHDIRSIQNEIVRFWDDDDKAPDKRVGVAENWFEKSIAGTMRGPWINFSENFDRDRDLNCQLDEYGISTAQRLWVFFQSSDDEYAAVAKDLRAETQWENQREIILALHALREKDIQLVVRMHPNMENKINDLIWWDNVMISFPQICFIPHDSPVNSYQLALRAEIVLTCGSSIGLESLYLGKSVICCGDSIYGFCQGVTSVYCFQQLAVALKSPQPAVDKQDILKVGYYRSERGEDFSYFVPTGILSGLFFGLELNTQEYLDERIL